MASDRDLPDAELDVMSCLWEGGAVTARAIREALGPHRPLSHSSVCTLLARLEAKGFVTREKGNVGKAFLYRAAVPPTRTKRRLVRSLLDRLFAGSGVDLVASLFESRPPTDRQLDELQQLLEELRNRKRKKPVDEEEHGATDAPRKPH